MSITCNLRESTRLTGSLGVATISTFGDATAAVTDILSPKTAYIATGKVTGTCTFDADTVDATATESDILLGETAYAGGVELTGTCTYNADTTNATATENSLLYGHTAYGADGTELTGTGAYWQYAKQPHLTFYGTPSTISGAVAMYTPNAVSFSSTFRDCTNITSVDLTFGAVTYFNSLFRGCTNCTTVTLHGSLSACTNFGDAFIQSGIVTINGDPLNFSGATTSLGNPFTLMSALVTIAFVQSTIKNNLSFAQSNLLSTASLLSIANGLHAPSAPKTLTMHATSKTNMDNINVDNVDGVAVLGYAMTLMQFINDIKGWTVA